MTPFDTREFSRTRRVSMTQTHWTKAAPEEPGHYFIRKEVEIGVKRVSVAEFVGDDDI
jgi:hypothetical protein